MAILNFKYGAGTPSAYEQGTVYVSTDNKKVYVGNPGGTGGFCIGDFIEVSVSASKGQQTALKALKGPQQNVLYLTYNTTDGYDLWKYNGTDFINLTKTGEILSLISALTDVVDGINSTVGNINTSLGSYVLKSEAPGYDDILTEEEAAATYETIANHNTSIGNLRTELVGVGASDSTDTIKKAIALAGAAQTQANKGVADAATAQAKANEAAEGVQTLTNKIGDVGTGTVKAYVDQAESDAVAEAKRVADLTYATIKDFEDLETTVSNNNSAVTETLKDYLKSADAASTYATKADENTRETTMRGGYAGTLKEINDLASAAKSKADTNEGNLATLTTTVSGYGTRLTDVEGVASGAASGVSTINDRLDGIGATKGAVKSAIDAAKEAAISSAKTAADAAYPTKAQLETTNSNLSDLTTKVGTVETTANNAKNDITTINSRLNGIGTGAGAVQTAINTAKEGAVSDAKTYADNTFATKETVSTLDSKVDDLIEGIGSLSNIMNFVGVTTSALTDGATTKPVVVGGSNHTQEIGDVVIYNATEFVWNGTKWEEIGNTSAETEALADLDERVDKLEAKTANSSELVKAVDKNTSDIGALDSRLDQAELDIDGLQGQLTWGTFTSLS